MQLHGHYESGILWAAGGLAEQPAAYLEAMSVLDVEIGKIMAKRNEKK